MATDQAPSPVTLRDVLHAVRRRKAALLLSVLLIAGGALGGSYLQTPVYQASAEVLLQARTSEQIFEPAGARLVPQRAPTEIRVFQSEPVQQGAQAQLGFDATVSVASIGTTDILRISAEHGSPRTAARIANAYAEAYIDFKRRQGIDDLVAAGNEIQQKIDEIQPQINSATDQVVRNVLVQQQASFQNQLNQIQLATALKTGGAQLVREAQPPTEPIRPKPVRNALVGAMLGMLVGLAAVALLEYFDDTIRSRDDLERAAPKLSLLGVIPEHSGWKSRNEAVLVSVSEPRSAVSEAYRTLRTSIQFLSVEGPIRCLQITSASASEGKTTTLANLATALARTGERVVVVCCDLRRPRVHEFFGLDNSIGFTSVLLGETSLSEALQPVPQVERIQILASGPLPPNPSELLSSRRAAQILEALQSERTYVLVDSPPVLPVADALLIAKQVSGVLMVASGGKTNRRDFARAAHMLEGVHAPLLGGVLNGVSATVDYGYSYYPYYHGGGSNGHRNRSARNGGRSRRKAPRMPA